MEGYLGSWSMEFLLRSPLADNNLIKKIIRRIPISDADSRLKKIILLKTLQDELCTVSIPESILETLELLEEHLRREDSLITAAMSAAYCAVAVECTLKYLLLEFHPDNPKYLDAVQRIWHGRVRYMEPSANASGVGSLLFSAELNRWRSDIRASLSDSLARDRLASIDTRREAVHKLKAYLAEAWVHVGPSFLELAASKHTNKGLHALTGNDAIESTNREDDCAGGKTKGACIATHEFTHQEKEIQKVNKMCSSVGAEEVDPSSTCSRVDFVPNCEVQKVGESHEPNLLDVADIVTSELAMKDMNEEQPPIENQSKDADTPCPHACEHINMNEEHKVNESTSVLQSGDHRPSLMEKNSTACTYEWDDEVDGVQGTTLNNASRFHLPSPKRMRFSPLKKYEPANITKRRKAKKWSQLEEETLRSAVDKFGKGNWKLILNSHRDIFEERTEVDLKDKWRNMTRYGCK